jgi:hypothetical protein
VFAGLALGDTVLEVEILRAAGINEDGILVY